jgi:hypothetical protein
MFRRLILCATLITVCQLGFALTCPSISSIKNNLLTGWKAYDSDDGTLLSKKRESQFKQNAQEFALAEWKWTGTDKTTGTIHCYYRDTNGSDLEAYLSKGNYSPENSRDYWYDVSGSMHCAAGMEKCEFRDTPVKPNSHLALR